MRPFLLTLFTLAAWAPAHAQSWICDSRYMTDQAVIDTWTTTTLAFANCTDPACAVQGDTLLMTVYVPTRSLSGEPLPEKLPFFLLLSGGGFLQGNHILTQWPEAFARRGFIVATIDYRIGWDINSDGVVNDVDFANDGNLGDCTGDFKSYLRAVIRAANDADKAVRYLLGDPQAYPIDTNLMYTGGPSAGAALGLMVGLSTESERLGLWQQFTGGTEPLIHTPCDMSVDPIPCKPMVNGTDTAVWYDGSYRFRGVMNCWGQYLLDLNSDSIQAAHGDVAIMSVYGAFDRVHPPYTGGGYGCPEAVPGQGSIRIHQIQMAHGRCSALYDDPDAVHKEVLLDGFATSSPLDRSILRNDRSVFIAQRACCFFKSALCGTPCSYPQAFVMDELSDYDQSWYNVEGRERGAPNGCEADGSLRFAPILPDDAFDDEDIYISPNPANGLVQVAWRNDAPNGNLKVFDAQGRMVVDAKVNNNQYAFDAALLEDGPYVVVLTDFGIRYTGKLVVVH
jgi:hypothetical protein